MEYQALQLSILSLDQSSSELGPYSGLLRSESIQRTAPAVTIATCPVMLAKTESTGRPLEDGLRNHQGFNGVVILIEA